MRSSSASTEAGSRAVDSSMEKCTRRPPAAPTVRAYSDDRGGQPALPVHLAAQLEQAQPQLGDHPGHLGAQRSAAPRPVSLGLVGQRGQRVVDAVADHDQLLGDPVVDLPGQPLALLVGGQRPDVVEEQRRLQPQRGRRGQRR